MSPSARGVAALLLCLPAGCAVRAPAPPAAAAAASRAAPVAETGVILAERRLPPRAPGDVRAAILASLGDGDVTSLPQPAVEFIVRAADGATLSVVQDDAAGLRPGERVAIRRAPHTVLTRILAVASGGMPGG
jgi:hypothetical protein